MTHSSLGRGNHKCDQVRVNLTLRSGPWFRRRTDAYGTPVRKLSSLVSDQVTCAATQLPPVLFTNWITWQQGRGQVKKKYRAYCFSGAQETKLKKRAAGVKQQKKWQLYELLALSLAHALELHIYMFNIHKWWATFTTSTAATSIFN